MDVSQETQNQQFLSKDNSKDGEIFEIMNEGEMVSVPFDDNDRLEIGIKKTDGSEVELDYTMNKTSLQNLMEEWGGETKDWVGKNLKINQTKQSIGGEMKTVIIAEPAVKESSV